MQEKKELATWMFSDASLKAKENKYKGLPCSGLEAVSNVKTQSAVHLEEVQFGFSFLGFFYYSLFYGQVMFPR